MWKYSHTHTHIYIYEHDCACHKIHTQVHSFNDHEQMKYLGRRPIQPRIGSASVFPHGDCKIPLLHEGSAVTKGTKCLETKLRWSRWPIELMPNCKSSTWCLLLLLSGGICNWDVDFSWHSFGAYHHCFLAARSPANSLMIIGLLSTNCPSISLCTVMGCLGQAAAEVFAANRRGLRASGSLALTLLFVGYIG